MTNANKILITCPKGLPPFLKKELISLGFPVLSEQSAGVQTEGTLDDAMRLNLSIRTGHRVLYLLREFSAANAEDLYREVFAAAWEDAMDEQGYLCVTSSVSNPTIKDSR